MEFHLDAERLILEVEKHQHLYDAKNIDFKNRELKRDTWISVTKNLIYENWEELDDMERSIFGKEVQRRWKSLKDSYFKYLKNDVGKSGDARKTKKPYIYSKHMAFLQAVYTQRETSGNMNTDDEVKSAEAPEARTNEPVKVATKSCTRMPNKRKADHFEREIINVLKGNLEQPPKVEQDADEMFLLSQLPLIKKIKPSDKPQFQIQFIQLIQTYINQNSDQLCNYKDTSSSTPSPANSPQLSTLSMAPSTQERQWNEDEDSAPESEPDNDEDYQPDDEDEKQSIYAYPATSGIYAAVLQDEKSVTTAAQPSELRVSKKRKTDDKVELVEKRMDEAWRYSKQVAAKPKVEKDETYLFCELLCTKLRALDDVTREIAMHEINGVMFRLKNSKRQQSFQHSSHQPGYFQSDVQQGRVVHQQHESFVHESRESSVSYVSPAQSPSTSPIKIMGEAICKVEVDY